MFDFARGLFGAGELDALLGGKRLQEIDHALAAVPADRLGHQVTAAVAELPADARAGFGGVLLTTLASEEGQGLMQDVLRSLGEGEGAASSLTVGAEGNVADAVAAGLPVAVARGLASGNLVALGRVATPVLRSGGLSALMAMFDAADGETATDRIVTGIAGMIGEDDAGIEAARVLANPLAAQVLKALVPTLIANAR